MGRGFAVMKGRIIHVHVYIPFSVVHVKAVGVNPLQVSQKEIPLQKHLLVRDIHCYVCGCGQWVWLLSVMLLYAVMAMSGNISKMFSSQQLDTAADASEKVVIHLLLLLMI